MLCGIQNQIWLQRCDTLHALGGDSTPPDMQAHTASELESGQVVDLGATDGSNGLDLSGWGFSRSCPFAAPKSLSIMGKTFDLDMTAICEFGPAIRAFILIMATFAVARIVAKH
jgi:hypothetical protein